MNKLKKIGLSALAGSLVAFSANAGEMSVSGSAGLYIGNVDEGKGSAFTSMGDSIAFTGSGELDNGMTIKLYYELDGDESMNGTASSDSGIDNFDTHYLTVSGDFGSFTYNGHGLGGPLDDMDDKTPNAYEEAWDAGNSAADDTLVGKSQNDSFHYSSPTISGATLSVSHSEINNSGITGSYNEYGITIKPEMVEGLEVGYAFAENEATATRTVDQDTAYIKYAYGPVTVGYQVAESESSDNSNGVGDDFETTAYGITFAVNDNMSIGYGVFDADYTSTSLSDQESKAITASYTMGSMTIGGLIGSDDNIKGQAADDNDKYEIGLSFAF